ncbi:MAG: DegT/DnrJ/EryC1/StrS family aminotransferase [Herbinix sp.]|nr:DegT/DnrJ/EryC1/StrS family aminotransferase [Herbinix sp.]
MFNNIIAIVQARMASTRLPGKILMPMMDKTILEQIINRVRLVDKISEVVIATTENKMDDLVEQLCKDKGIPFFRGSEENVLERFYLCAKLYNAEVIVRITADDPFKEPKVIAKAIEFFETGDYDYVSNTIEPTYPEGIDIEVFSFTALEMAYLEASLASEKEHVTPYLYKNSEKFKLYNFTNDIDLSVLRWTVDSPEDYLFVHKIYNELYKKPNEIFDMDEILKLLEEKPELKDINRGHMRNEGYQKSIQQEETLKNKDLLKQEEDTTLKQRIYGNELKYVQEVLNTEFRSSKGAMMMQRLEKAFAEKIGTKYAISLINGTCTLHAILEAAGISVGDEVIVPPLTMSSTTFAVLQANATPIYADVDPNSFVISPKSIKSRITAKTKAIITVSLYGLSPDMDVIMEIADKYHLLVIEDNAECLLGTYKGRKVGTLGHIASYSFQSSKHITSGEGGMVVTDSLELAEAVRRVSSLGYAGVGASKAKITKQTIQDPDYSRHVSMGWNYRMPELCAAVALGQLENAEALVSRRIKVAKMYAEAIADTSWLLPQFVEDEHVCTYWTFAVKLEHPTVTWNEFRDQFVTFGGDGIYAAWKLTYLEPMMTKHNLLGRDKFISHKNKSKYKYGLCPIAEDLQESLLQFKTNYWKEADALKQVEILKKTIKFFDEWGVSE